VPALGVLTLVAAMLVAVVKLWWRRPLWGAKKRCGNCGYSLQGLREARCPECGQEAGTRRPSRLHWVAVALGLVLLGGQLLQWKQRTGEPTWLRVVPTTAWCLVERWWPAQDGSTRHWIVGTRLEHGRGWGWQVRLALGGRASADALARCVVVPERWPEGEPIVERTRWRKEVWAAGMPGWARVSLSVESADAPGESASIYSRPTYIASAFVTGMKDDLILLPSRAPGATRVPVRIRAMVDGALVLDRTEERTVQVVPRGTRILSPVVDADLTMRIVNRTSVEASAGEWRVLATDYRDSVFPTLRVGVKIELVASDGTLLPLKDPISGVVDKEWRSPRLDGHWWYTSFPLPADAVEAGADNAYDERRTPLPGRLRLRMSGDEVAALRHLDGDSYWAGTVEMPLAEWVHRSKHQRDYLNAEKKPGTYP